MLTKLQRLKKLFEKRYNETYDVIVGINWNNPSPPPPPPMLYRQLCLIRTGVDPEFLSGLGKIRITHIGIICIRTDWDLQICPV